MSQYVIERTFEWKEKSGETKTSKSYFKCFTTIVFPLVHLSNIQEARKYSTRALAAVDKRRYFQSREKVSIVKVTPEMIKPVTQKQLES